MKRKDKNKKTTITTLDLMPRDANVVGMIGRSRTFRNKARIQKSDKTGRKAKHKGGF